MKMIKLEESLMEETMVEIFEWFRDFLSGEWAVFLTAWLPFAELRLSIPLGIARGIDPERVYLLAVIGNMVPVIPLLLLLKPVKRLLKSHFSLMKKFFDYLDKRTIKKSDKVDKYGAFGLILFTAVPFPTTGAWTASLAAVLFNIKFKYAFLAISFGVIIAGIVVMIMSLVIW